MQVAIKVLHTRLDQNFQAGFLQEAETIAGLRHPLIIRIFDFGIESGDNTPYLIMEYAKHGTLRNRHQRGSIIPLATVASYINQIAQSLQYAHDHNLIHRDLKPENLLVGDEGEILLSDFGIAVVVHGTSSIGTGTYAGTVPYSAPEQILGKPRRASDQYSLGVIVYEWLTGDRPFRGTLQEIISQHLGASPRPLHKIIPTIPPNLEAVIMNALAKEPRERFDSMIAFASAFEHACNLTTPLEFLTEKSVQAQPLTPTVSHIIAPYRRQMDAETRHSQQRYTTPIVTSPARTAIQQSKPITAPGINPRTTRRKLLLMGAAGISAIGIGGVISWWKIFQASFSNSENTTPVTTRMSIAKPKTIPAGTTLHTYHGQSEEYSIALAPSGKYIASGEQDGTVQVWEVASGKLQTTYKQHKGGWIHTTWSPDSQKIASGGDDNTVLVWDAMTGKTKITYTKHTDVINAVTWSPDGKSIASGSKDNWVLVWDASTGETNVAYQQISGVLCLAWSPDGKMLASGAETVSLLSPNRNNLKFIYTGLTGNVLSVAWSPDGKRLVSGSDNYRAYIWDVTGDLHLTYKGHFDAVLSVAWSPDGKSIASGSADRSVQVWNPDTGKRTLTYTGHSGWVYSIAWSSDSKSITSGSEDTTVQVWRAV